jgi:hypothetical protein
MNFSGTLDESNGMTITRLIERIVHTDTPGELRLRDEAGERKAMVAIRRGMVEEVSYNDLTGDPALTAISQACPWTFEFVADEAGAQPAHPQMISRRPKARAVVRVGGPKPVTGPVPVAEPEEPAAAAPGLAAAHRQWIASPDSHHTIRFGLAGEEVAGEVHEDDHDYFRSDYEFLVSMARGIGRALGEEDAPRLVAIAEPERATGYCAVEGGFLGIIGGAGAGVDYVIEFPESTAAA